MCVQYLSISWCLGGGGGGRKPLLYFFVPQSTWPSLQYFFNHLLKLTTLASVFVGTKQALSQLMDPISCNLLSYTDDRTIYIYIYVGKTNSKMTALNRNPEITWTWRRHKSESRTRFCSIWEIHLGMIRSIQRKKFLTGININLLLPGLTGTQRNTTSVFFSATAEDDFFCIGGIQQVLKNKKSINQKVENLITSVVSIDDADLLLKLPRLR